jgi:CubicO group peptidase (beta-lactamase class C family)
MCISFYRLSNIIIFVAVLALVFGPAAAQKPAGPSIREIKYKVNEYMKAAVEFERFTGSVLIAKDGNPIFSKGYGMANIEFDAPNTPDTVFRLASVSKQFTAAAIMLLQERGKLNVNDLACQYLAECPASWRTITIRHLLTMTHGIPGINSAEIGALRGLPIPMDQWFEATSKKPLEYAPGEKFKYLNAGYTVLGLIIERVSGKSYGDFMQENIFAPLGMKRTAYEDPFRIIKNRATGYNQLPGNPVTNLPYREIVRFHAAGGIYSTTEDMFLWDKALYTEKLLSKRSIEEMFTPYKELYPGRSYAYGWTISQKFGRKEIAHGGNATGFITYFARYPVDRVTVIVLSNNASGSSGKISNALSAIVFGAAYEIPRERKAIPVESSVLDKYIGKYYVQSVAANFVISKENGKLMTQRDNESKEELFAESENKFFLKTMDQQFTFVKDLAGNVTGLHIDLGDGVIYEYLRGERIH